MNGIEQKPSLRFRGFVGAWEQYKLHEFVTYTSSNLSVSDASENGKFDLYDANNIIGKTNESPIKNEYISIVKDGAGVGRIRKMPKNTLFIGTMGAIQSNNSDISFVHALLNRFDLSVGYSGSTIPHIYFKDYGKNAFLIPSDIEQAKIGKLFDRIETLITLRQRKCEKLATLKSSLLERMFPRNGANTPEIRFKGFADAWEQREFGYFFDERNERTGEGEMISVTMNSGIKKFKDLERFDTKPEDLSKYKKVVVGDIAFNSMRMWQGASGYSPYTGILSPAYTVITPKNGNSSPFFSYVLKKPEMIQLFQASSQGLTKDTWNLKFPAFSKLLTYAPNNYDEQSNIANILTKVDSLITLHQRKLEKLQNIKKSLLNLMFVS